MDTEPTYIAGVAYIVIFLTLVLLAAVTHPLVTALFFLIPLIGIIALVVYEGCTR